MNPQRRPADTDHLSVPILNALADGELSADQLAKANHHLSQCPSCTSDALYQSLLKSATAKAGQRYAPTPNLQARMALRVREELSLQNASHVDNVPPVARSSIFYGWAAAAALLLISIGIALVQHNWSRTAAASAQYAAIATEASDQHIATLAVNSPPEVISSDRHTVKPWFQGKHNWTGNNRWGRFWRNQSCNVGLLSVIRHWRARRLPLGNPPAV